MLTVDQRRSRRSPDRVEATVSRLASQSTPLRPFERTAGDEFQGVLDDAEAAVDVVLLLLREGWWSVGVGVGPVRGPLPPSTRAGAGPAFEHARTAVERAKRHPQGVAVVGPVGASAHDAEVVLALVATLVQRRSAPAWEAVDLAVRGLSTTEVAAQLGVTRQAVGQRLATAQWQLEQQARPLAARLLAQAEVAR